MSFSQRPMLQSLHVKRVIQRIRCPHGK